MAEFVPDIKHLARGRGEWAWLSPGDPVLGLKKHGLATLRYDLDVRVVIAGDDAQQLASMASRLEVELE